MSAGLPASGYASPLSVASSTSLPSTASKAGSSRPKPVNVFSNDGSFLERFQRSRQEEEDRRKAEEALTTKKHFADRFKKRGKRPPPPDSSAVTSTDLDPNPTKRPKLDNTRSVYERDVRDRDTRTFKNTGTGVRPSVK